MLKVQALISKFYNGMHFSTGNGPLFDPLLQLCSYSCMTVLSCPDNVLPLL